MQRYRAVSYNKAKNEEMISVISSFEFLRSIVKRSVDFVHKCFDPRNLTDQRQLCLFALSGVDNADDRKNAEKYGSGAEQDIKNMINRGMNDTVPINSGCSRADNCHSDTHNCFVCDKYRAECSALLDMELAVF